MVTEVIGSGASGVAAATGLFDRGLDRVVMLDVGEEIEPETKRAVDKLHDIPDDRLDTEFGKLLSGNYPIAADDIPEKTVFGSRYPYREPSNAPKIQIRNAKVTRSFAKGGLSNVWGASALPYHPSEMMDWPIESGEMNGPYRTMLNMMSVVGRNSDFADLFPDIAYDHDPPVISQQSDQLLRSLSRHRSRLMEKGIIFGAAHNAYLNSNKQCRRCSKCLFGCPQDIIYCSRHTLETLIQKGLTYRSKILVQRLIPSDSYVAIEYRNLLTNKIEVLNADRVFVAAGIWNTASLVLESMQAYGASIVMKHSDRFTIPILQHRAVEGAHEEKTNTLSQIFIEVLRQKICPKVVHLQVYGCNEFIQHRLDSLLLKAGLRALAPRNYLLSRIMVAYGYIHSDYSSSLVVSLEKSQEPSLVIKGVDSSESSRVARRVMGLLWSQLLTFEAFFGAPKMDLPGGGNHSGGCFPMRRNPKNFETNKWGEIPSFSRVHLVDATVLPSISGAPIQLTAMANAYRIASRHPR